MLASTLLLIIFLGITLVWLLQPAKRVIVQPVKMDGTISQQTFLAEKKMWEVLWESDLVKLVRLVLAGMGLVWMVSWFF